MTFLLDVLTVWAGIFIGALAAVTLFDAVRFVARRLRP